MIVTIDGPAGAGKSSAARALAARLGFRFLDTGSMYRAVALAGLRDGVDWNAPSALAELARRVRIEPSDETIYLDGQDVSAAIRTTEVTSLTRFAADNPDVRAHLVELQRRWADHGDVVAEGRDQGTVVFPHAECKVFLTASAEERARRRQEDLRARGEEVPLAELVRQQAERDAGDAAREVGPLIRAVDAVELLTDGLSPEEVVDRLESLVRDRMPRPVA